jgi:hypothetical protein
VRVISEAVRPGTTFPRSRQERLELPAAELSFVLVVGAPVLRCCRARSAKCAPAHASPPYWGAEPTQVRQHVHQVPLSIEPCSNHSPRRALGNQLPQVFGRSGLASIALLDLAPELRDAPADRESIYLNAVERACSKIRRS